MWNVVKADTVDEAAESSELRVIDRRKLVAHGAFGAIHDAPIRISPVSGPAADTTAVAIQMGCANVHWLKVAASILSRRRRCDTKRGDCNHFGNVSRPEQQGEVAIADCHHLKVLPRERRVGEPREERSILRSGRRGARKGSETGLSLTLEVGCGKGREGHSQGGKGGDKGCNGGGRPGNETSFAVCRGKDTGFRSRHMPHIAPSA